MDDVEIREQIPEPDVWAALFGTTGWNERYRTSARDLDAALRASTFVLSAWRGDRLVGLGRVVSDGVLYATVCDLVVAPSEQGRGIGSALLDGLVARCRDAAIRNVQLFCALGKQPFYEKRGFAARPVGAPGMVLATTVARREERLAWSTTCRSPRGARERLETGGRRTAPWTARRGTSPLLPPWPTERCRRPEASGPADFRPTRRLSDPAGRPGEMVGSAWPAGVLISRPLGSSEAKVSGLEGQERSLPRRWGRARRK